MNASSDKPPGIAPTPRARELLAAGHAFAGSGDFHRAAEAYAAAASEQPDCPDTHFNLGVARHRLHDADGALRALMRAWQVDATFSLAAKACMSLLRARVRERHRWARPPVLRLSGKPPSIAVIVCSIDDTKAAATASMYRRLLDGVPHSIQVLRDARSLSEAYNRGVAASHGEFIVLSHDDIEVLAEDFAARLLAHLRAFDVVGVVGSTRMTGPVPVWAGHPWVSGWITHHAPDDSIWTVNTLGCQPVAGGIQVLDGVLLAARREVFVDVPFDAEMFDGFHGYDVDWSYRAAMAGWRLAAAGDLRVVHASGGRYDAVWSRYAARLCAKHGVGASAAAESPYFAVNLSSAEETAAFFDGFMQVAAAASCNGT